VTELERMVPRLYGGVGAKKKKKRKEKKPALLIKYFKVMYVGQSMVGRKGVLIKSIAFFYV
jgi:hypothetical protein